MSGYVAPSFFNRRPKPALPSPEFSGTRRTLSARVSPQDFNRKRRRNVFGARARGTLPP